MEQPSLMLDIISVSREYLPRNNSDITSCMHFMLKKTQIEVELYNKRVFLASKVNGNANAVPALSTIIATFNNYNAIKFYHL